MTLDELIAQSEELAARCEADTDWGMGNHFIDRSGVTDIIECGKVYRQLALWLRELKAYRQAWERIPREIEKKQLNTGDPSERAAYGDSLEIIRRNLDELMEGFDGLRTVSCSDLPNMSGGECMRWIEIYHYGFGYTKCPYCGSETGFFNPFIDKFQTDVETNARTHCPTCGKRVYAREGYIINQPPLNDVNK